MDVVMFLTHLCQHNDRNKGRADVFHVAEPPIRVAYLMGGSHRTTAPCTAANGRRTTSAHVPSGHGPMTRTNAETDPAASIQSRSALTAHSNPIKAGHHKR